MQKRVEMAFLIVLAFADVRWNVQVPVGLRGVTGKMLPAEVILESKTAQCPCYRLGRVSEATWLNALRVSDYQ